jgi:tetratricopeptide (TPR) repeat protein
MIRTIALAGVLFVPVAAQADDEPVRSDFWQGVSNPEVEHGRRQARKALPFREAAEGPVPPHRRQVLLERALRRLELAEEHAPNDPEVLYYLAETTARLADSRDELAELALARFQRLRQVDPGFETENVASEVGILHTRARRFTEAQIEYESALAFQLSSRSSDRARLYGNLAEVTMLAGDLERAIQYYEASHRAAEEPRQFALALWGSAVCLDRLGEHAEAIDKARTALASEAGMAVLRSEGVFFEPQFEIHWYEALAHEASASVEPARADRHLAAARESWRHFLSDGGDNESPWAPLARERLAAVEQAIGHASRARPVRREPRAPRAR